MHTSAYALTSWSSEPRWEGTFSCWLTPHIHQPLMAWLIFFPSFHRWTIFCGLIFCCWLIFEIIPPLNHRDEELVPNGTARPSPSITVEFFFRMHGNTNNNKWVHCHITLSVTLVEKVTVTIFNQNTTLTNYIKNRNKANYICSVLQCCFVLHLRCSTVDCCHSRLLALYCRASSKWLVRGQ